MKDIEIKITKSTRYVDIEKPTEKIGNEGENLQTNLVFSFTDNFVDGQGRLEYRTNGEDRYVTLNKIGETYQTPVKSEMTKKGTVDMQLVITEGTDENEIPKFKSNVFYLPFGESINAEMEQPEEYEEWIDVANTKLNEFDNLNIDMQDGVVTITRKDGSQYSEDVNGDDYIITEEDYATIESNVREQIQPTLKSNLEEAKSYADSIKPTKTSELINDSNFAKTNQNNNFSTSQTVNGTLTINGDIVQNGASYETHAEQIYTEKDEIITRDGAVGGLNKGELTGIRAKKYDGSNDGQLGFDADGTARVGDVGDTQPLLTRDEAENLTTGQVLVWDGTNLKAVGSDDYVKNTDVASETKLGLIKTWMSTNEDGEIGLNISTEV